MASSLVHVRSSGVSLVVDAGAERLPRVMHWGADLGDLDDAALGHLALASVEPELGSDVDERLPISVVPEAAWGWVGTPGLEGSRDGRDHSARFTATSTVVDDVTGDGSRTQRIVTRAADAVAELGLTVEIELLHSGLIRARCSLTSTGTGSAGEDASPAPYALAALNLLFPVPRRATEVLDFTGRWIRERVPQRTAFTVGTRLRETRRGKPGHDSAFLLAAGTEGFAFRRGEVWLTHVAWSGNSRYLAERSMTGRRVIGGGELPMSGEIRLHPGETYQGPWVYFSYGQRGLDEASNRIHSYLRSRESHPRSPRPVVVNTWEAVYFDHDIAALHALADAAAEVGAERFVLDDGWFRHRRSDNAGLGDWFVDESVYPDGLLPLADSVRARGMEFGLWVEPEMINPDSDLARAQPEWIAQPESTWRRERVGGDARLPLPARRQQVLDLTHPQAYAYIEERLHALVAHLRPSYLKWDHNRDLIEAGSTATGRAIVHEQTLALYRLIDGLKARFPGLEIESCAGGGGRIDLGILERTDRVWASDSNDPLERQRIQLYTTLLVPPEMMGAHIGPPQAHTTHRTASLDFRAGTALWGHLGLEWNVASPEASAPDAREQLKQWIALYKQLRGLLHSGEVVRVDLDEPTRALHGVVAQDRSEALFAYAALDSSYDSPLGGLRLEGLADDRLYRILPVGTTARHRGGPRGAPDWWLAAAADASGAPELRGRVLREVGIQAPGLDPQEVVLIHVVAHS